MGVGRGPQPRYQSKEIKILSTLLFPRVENEPRTCSVYSRTLELLRHDLKLYYIYLASSFIPSGVARGYGAPTTTHTSFASSLPTSCQGCPHALYIQWHGCFVQNSNFIILLPPQALTLAS